MTVFNIFQNMKKVDAPWKKYYSKEEMNIKISDISLYQQVLNSSYKYPNYIAYKYLGKKVTYKKFIRQIDKAAIAFQQMNIKEGDVVTICLPNLPESLITFYALNKLGAIANMLHPLSADEEIKYSLNSTNSKYLVMVDMFFSKIKKNIYDTKVKKVVLVSPGDSLSWFKKIFYYSKNITKNKKYYISKRYISWTNFINKATFKKLLFEKEFGKNTPAAILHSGGTSGKPKNVVLQNRAFILGAKQEMIVLKKLKPGDCCLAIMPNFHGFGLSVCMHTPLTSGCYTILVPQFNAKKFDVLFNKEKPTAVLGVPTLYEAFIKNKNVPDIDLSFLKYVICGGDILSKNLEDNVNEYLKKHNSQAVITQGYGLSEALAAVTLGTPEHNKSGSVGIPLPGNYIKIINTDTRKTNPYNEIGEICINTKAFMLEYLNNPQETNEALQVHEDKHIWLHTGDLGYMDSDGFIFYTGRLKRMIITSGYNVYPSYVEKIIESHPAVLQCTVIGIPHPYKKEVLKAFIVLKDGYINGLIVKADIKEYCKKNLTKYMIPCEFVYRTKLPKTLLGKIDFKKLEVDFDNDDY